MQKILCALLLLTPFIFVSPANVSKADFPAEIKIPKILAKIAYCESGNRQFTQSGDIVRGVANPNDLGKYQVNSKIWGEKAKELGYNLMTLDGNTQMALWLYKNYGTKPWVYSKPCWSKIT